MSDKFAAQARQLIAVTSRFEARGWALGTSGNFSAVLNRQPLRLAITASGRSKAELRAADILEVDGRGVVIGRRNGRRPSAETQLHVEIVRRRGAGAVLHTHSVWSTILSDAHAIDGGFFIHGYEMLKGLEGVMSHEHREWVPIVENSQDLRELAARVADTLQRYPDAHGFLIRRHGLYTWGADLRQAARHIEIFEFLFEVLGRSRAADESR